MITWFARHSSRLMLTLATMFTIAACGGGGGGGGGGGFLPADDPSENYNLLLELTNVYGEETRVITTSAPALLTVTVKGGKRAVDGIVVTASSDVGVVVPEVTGTSLTDMDGVALFRMESDGTVGAGTITVSITVDSVSTTETLTFQVERPDLRLGYFEENTFFEGLIEVVPEEITAGGSASVTIAIVDATGERVTTEETILLGSDCARNGDAILPASVVTLTGQIDVTYTAAGCEGDDVIGAVLLDSGSEARGTVNVAPAEVGSLNFVSAEPELIALKGTGGAGRQESSKVTFATIDGQGTPIPGVLVEFELSTEIGGLTLDEPSDITDADGLAVAVVRSGNVATSVRVIASVEVTEDDIRSTVSDALVVSTGLPDADSISLSSSVLNVGGALDFDGRTATLTVRMADKFNNPVADGTSALFTTEYGSIVSTCSTVGGLCSVTWTSQDPRFPTFNQDLVRTIFDSDYSCASHSGGSGPCPDDLGAIRGLRSTIVVSVIGEEYFKDANGNGLYDPGEQFENLPEAFIDKNEDGVYTPALGPQCGPPSTPERCAAAGAEEDFYDFNEDGEYSLNVSPPQFPNGVYNGSLCPPEGDDVYCSKDLVIVSDSIVLIMSSSSSYSSVIANARSGQVSSTLQEGVSYVAYVSDLYNNRPPGGTSVTISTKGDCALLTEGSFQVADSNSRGAFGGGSEQMNIQIDGGGGQGTLSVAVAVSGGSASTETYNCSTIPTDPNAPGGGGIP
ncbi:MAG: hypothetical protein V7754_10855 [Halioglobus sp.]